MLINIKIYYEFILFILTLLSITSIFVEEPLLNKIDFIVYVIFLIDVIIRLYLSENKLKFIKSNLFDFIAIIPFDSIFKVARIVRLIRLLRSVSILKRYSSVVLQILRQHGLVNALLFIIIAITSLSVPIYIIEPNIASYGDALWWAVTTTTTVGYGDLSPETTFGRIIGFILMISGIGVIGLLTSSLASHFIQSNNQKCPTKEYLKNKIERLEELSNNEIDRVCLILKSYKKQ
ncbi:ion transporter [Staphylococcus aureus]|uniref:ion transporter n=1 Tax=Staphylococcus aureus TaxID=1280 RepID=UPI0012B086E7|nr:ion transporter [Staphylococcus aureus]MRV56430.1 hypothetical protein [Staphylococcus aureus]